MKGKETGTQQKPSYCRSCGDEVDVRNDEWWSHTWEENPSKENVEKALEDREFRDWFRENFILCPDCHKQVVELILDE